jgi:4a-hydroxytetrahydrobiopterin dehydratase
MLANKTCTPVSKGAAYMDAKVVPAMLGQVPGWALAEKQKAIFRKFTVADFDSAYALAQSIARIAQEQNHHPDINFGWGFVKCRITTHAVGESGGLSENDFILAAKISAQLDKALPSVAAE